MKVSNLLELKGDSIVAVRPNSSFRDAVANLVAERVGLVVVTSNEGQLLGVISERDIVRNFDLHGGVPNDVTVETFMTRSVVTCVPTDPVRNVLEQMGFHGIRHVPVVSGETLVGVISIRDVLKFRVRMLEQEIDTINEIRTPMNGVIGRAAPVPKSREELTDPSNSLDDLDGVSG